MDARAPDSTPEKFAQAGMNRRPGHWAKRQVSSYRCGGEGWLGIQTQAGATGGWWEVLMNALLTAGRDSRLFSSFTCLFFMRQVL
jgi:hypothetical protein